MHFTQMTEIMQKFNVCNDWLPVAGWPLQVFRKLFSWKPPSLAAFDSGQKNVWYFFLFVPKDSWMVI